MTTTGGPSPATDFTTSEGLRTLLHRLHDAGPRAWRTDAEATELMRYAAEKYAPLARKHGLDAWEAAGAAFDAMRTPAVRKAHDPWAVVTRAVQVTCIAEERANGLLCSPHQARRVQFSVFHDAERFSDRDNPLSDFHPAFHHHDPANAEPEPAESPEQVPESTAASSAVEDTIALFTLLGWPPHTARGAIEYVCERLARAGSRHSAFEALRRDKPARALLDLPASSWHGLLRVVLGSPEPAHAGTSLGRGVLLRLLIGEPLRALLRDDDLVLTITVAAPHPSSQVGGQRE